MVTITADSTREDVIEALANLVARARTEARRGVMGLRQYESTHANIDVLLTELEGR